MAIRYGRSFVPDLLARIDMTPAEFARRIRVTKGYVSRIISGEKHFSLLKAKEASIVLNCTIEDLQEFIEERGEE